MKYKNIVSRYLVKVLIIEWKQMFYTLILIPTSKCIIQNYVFKYKVLIYYLNMYFLNFIYIVKYFKL